MLSGMRPTGTLHLGNYFGALKPWIDDVQGNYPFYAMVADLHSLTTLEETSDIRKKTLEMIALWLACGLNPEKTTVFLQSAVPEHGELNTIFSTLLPTSMLELNPTYKEMVTEHPKSGSFGILNYPVLQAADILLYKASRVPVGRDQESHIEIAREIAHRFNNHFGEFFSEPHALFSKTPKIYSLADPEKKMSKSGHPDSFISLLDDENAVARKIKRAVTDSENNLGSNLGNSAVAHLIELYRLVGGKINDPKDFDGKYAIFKSELASSVSKMLLPIQERYRELISNTQKIEKVLADGTERARVDAQKNLADIKQKIGLLQF